MNIGDIFRALHMADATQVEAAAEAQRHRFHGKRLGEVLEAQGVLKRKDVLRALAAQAKLRDDPEHACVDDVAAVVDYAASLTEDAALKMSRKLR